MAYKAKYFKPHELKCKCCKQNVKPQLLPELDKLREMLGFPLIVTSGKRCRKYNKSVDGAKDSAHIGGWAADLVGKTKWHRQRIVSCAVELGFRGVGLYPTSKFVHVDINPKRKQFTFWYSEE